MSRRTPKPTKEELELRDLQLQSARGEAELSASMNEIVKSQLAYYQAMEPVYLKEVGMEKITDPETGSVSYKYTGNKSMDTANEIERLSQERTLQALKGELPVDPALERNIKKDRYVLNQYLYKNIGEGFETSTPGIQLLSENTQRNQEAREASRRGELAGANALTLNAQQAKSNVNTNNPVNVGFGSGAGAIQAGTQTYGSAGSNAGNYQQPYQYDRNQQFQYNMAKYAAKKNLQGALIGGGMQMGAQALGGLAGSGFF